MKHHVLRYRIALVVITLLLLIPQAFYLFEMFRYVPMIGLQSIRLPSIPGFTARNTVYSTFSHAVMWRGMFVRVRPNHDLIRSRMYTGWAAVNDYVLEFADPVTEKRIGEITPLKTGYYRPIVLDDRLFLVGSPFADSGVTESYEFVDNDLKPFDFIWPEYHPMLLIEDKLFRIQGPPSFPKVSVTTVQSGKWTVPREIVIPGFCRSTTPLGDQIVPDESEVQCLNDGANIYTFLRCDGRLYFRLGLTLHSTNDPRKTETYGVDGPGQSSEIPPDSVWNLVQDPLKPLSKIDKSDVAIIDGWPAALLVSGEESRRPIGHLCKFNGNEWREESTIQFPLGSNHFRLLPSGKSQATYVVATTSTGTGFAWKWEDDGVHEVAGQGPALTWSHMKSMLRRDLPDYGRIWGLGLLPCLAAGWISRWSTCSKYSFGLCTIQLASFWQRAVARLIDLALLATLSFAIGAIMMRNANWFEVAESWNLQLSHPDIRMLFQTVYVEIIVLTAAYLSLILVQGVWGFTPGKWICGLKIVRTNLRQCGISRSLVREALLALDSTYLLWWVRGTLSLCLTDNRQRLGDLVSDTIVIRKNSLKVMDTSEMV